MAKERENFSDRLDQSIIDLTLLEKIEAGQRPKTKKKSYFDVIIEVNLRHRGGRPKARREARLMLKKVLEDPGLRPAKTCGIREMKSRYSSRYIFAHLHCDQIRALAREQIPIRFTRQPIYKIWLDEEVEGQLTKSVQTVKADAAQAAFSAAGRYVVWAVVDSGIQGDHIHFRKFDNLNLEGVKPVRHADFSGEEKLNASPGAEPPAAEADTVSPEDLVDPFGHGTHVAGIIAGGVDPEFQEREQHEVYAARRIRDDKGKAQVNAWPLTSISGVAPQTKLVDLRVLDARGKGKVSNIIAALGFIREINDHGRWLRIHGVNLSVGYEFDAEAYACGQSPLCVAVNRLVRSGVVVVAAAGNTGYGRVAASSFGSRGFKTSMAVTINDPGNAELAITVGATHREKPHIYGTSYFSSRGPTADGRWKPDLLAPGEKIISCAAGKPRAEATSKSGESCEYREESGTSMAAPHVSGCIAAFLSIRTEFQGEPERVKEIFLSTATDLGRERYFQGRGLIDLMRAIQSV